MDMDTQERSTVFEQELQDELDAVYHSRQSALDAAFEVESYCEGSVRVFRFFETDIYLLSAAEFVSKPEPSIDFDANGRYDEESLDFHGDDPDAYRFVPSMNAVGWERLQPVKDFLDGKAETVDIASAYVEGWVADDDDEDAEAIEDTGLWALMAWKDRDDD